MKYLAFTLFAALLLPGQAPKQAPTKQTPRPAAVKPPTPDADDVAARITLDVTRVNMLYTVSDKKGRFVTDLKKDDFEIIESKKKQSIQEFTAETDLPLRLAILVDTSNSIRERFKFIQEAATDFVNAVVRANQDRAIVVSFDTSSELVADLTDDTVTLAQAIRN